MKNLGFVPNTRLQQARDYRWLVYLDERIVFNVSNFLAESFYIFPVVLISQDYEAVVKLSDGFNGADLRNVCTEAGNVVVLVRYKSNFMQYCWRNVLPCPGEARMQRKLLYHYFFTQSSHLLNKPLGHSYSGYILSSEELLFLNLSRFLRLIVIFCVGMFAIRADRDYVVQEDFMKAVRKVSDNKKLETKLDYKPV